MVWKRQSTPSSSSPSRSSLKIAQQGHHMLLHSSTPLHFAAPAVYSLQHLCLDSPCKPSVLCPSYWAEVLLRNLANKTVAPAPRDSVSALSLTHSHTGNKVNLIISIFSSRDFPTFSCSYPSTSCRIHPNLFHLRVLDGFSDSPPPFPITTYYVFSLFSHACLHPLIHRSLLAVHPSISL